MNPITKLCIIRASREDHQKVWSAITMVRSIGNCPVLFSLLDLSGKFNTCNCSMLNFKDEMGGSLNFSMYAFMKKINGA